MRKQQSSKYDFICIHCGKQFHNCQRGPNYIPKFCSRECFHAHAIKRSGICVHCGKQFFYELKGRKIPIHCSRECWYETRREEKTCILCGIKFIVRKNESKIYCSRKCSDKRHDESKKTISICLWCKKPFEHWTYRKSKLCSNQCRSEYGASIRAKQLYKGESPDYGMGWKRIAMMVRKEITIHAKFAKNTDGKIKSEYPFIILFHCESLTAIQKKRMHLKI